MATETTSIGDKPVILYFEGERHELIIRVRTGSPALEYEKMKELYRATLKVWMQSWQAIKHEAYIEADENINAHQRAFQESGLQIEPSASEPYITMFNKRYDALSITVQDTSKPNEAFDLYAAHTNALADIMDKAPKLFQAPVSTPKPSASQAPDIDEFLKDDPYQQSKQAPQSTGDANHPFRMFKRIAPSVIQMQEFIQGGGEKYQKSAIEATQAWHKKNPQDYDEGALVYYPITGAISLKEGRFGLQASIVTAKGSVYLDATNRNDEETVDWQAFKKDFAWAWDALETQGYYAAAGCLLVLKMSAASGDVQWKNYYHIYQAYHENNLPIGG